jgi:hypothetical protein
MTLYMFAFHLTYQLFMPFCTHFSINIRIKDLSLSLFQVCICYYGKFSENMKIIYSFLVVVFYGVRLFAYVNM